MGMVGAGLCLQGLVDICLNNDSSDFVMGKIYGMGLCLGRAYTVALLRRALRGESPRTREGRNGPTALDGRDL